MTHTERQLREERHRRTALEQQLRACQEERDSWQQRADELAQRIEVLERDHATVLELWKAATRPEGVSSGYALFVRRTVRFHDLARVLSSAAAVAGFSHQLGPSATWEVLVIDTDRIGPQSVIFTANDRNPRGG